MSSYIIVMMFLSHEAETLAAAPDVDEGMVNVVRMVDILVRVRFKNHWGEVTHCRGSLRFEVPDHEIGRAHV